MADIRELEDLLYLLRCAVDRRSPDRDRVSSMDLDRLYELSRFHSLAALTYTAVEAAFGGQMPRDGIPAGWKAARDAAVRNTLLFAAERKALEAFCEERKIWYLPLKGILLQNDYPGLGLREMADNDIWFDAAFQKPVHDWFVARGYTVEAYRQGVHDSYHKPPVFNFEMHTDLFDQQKFPAWTAYFEAARNRLLSLEGTCWGRRFTLEDFYLYILTHMYKHFAGGGTGLRSLLDLYLFRRAHGGELNGEILRQGLAQLDLMDFECETRALTERIFGCEEALRPADAEVLLFYLSSGTYGTADNRMRNTLRKFAGESGAITRTTKLRYLWRRLFPDRAFMETWCRREAPFFLQHRGLLLLAPWYRVGYNLVVGRAGKMKRELQALRKQ